MKRQRFPSAWTLAAGGALILCSMVFALEWTLLVDARDTATSASVGLWWFAMLSLLAGVAERWLAGKRRSAHPSSGAGGAGRAPERRHDPADEALKI